MASKVSGQARLQDPQNDHDGDLWVAENLISYDGAPYMFTVNILVFRGDKVAHERLYVFEGFEAAEWRAEWAERFDPLESKSPQDWREDIEAAPRPAITDEV